jgi:hypothetical protein
VRKAKAIHRSWHIDVGEHQPDISARFEDADRLVRVARITNLKAGVLENVDSVHPDEEIIFDDKDGGRVLVFHTCRTGQRHYRSNLRHELVDVSFPSPKPLEF